MGLSCFLPPQSCGDSSPDTFSDGLSSSTLPDDHSSYTAQGYVGQDLEVEQALTPGEDGFLSWVQEALCCHASRGWPVGPGCRVWGARYLAN